MRIKKIEIKNFKCLGPNPIELDFSEDILILIGENNTGKFSVLKALEIFFTNTKKLPKGCFLNHEIDIDKAVEITITFNELTSKDEEHQSISGYTFIEENQKVWKIKKKYYYKDDGDDVCQYFAIVNKEEKENPGGRQTNVDDLFHDDKMQIAFIEAVKDVLDTTKSSSRSTSVFQQVFNLLIESSLHGTRQYNNLVTALEKYKDLLTGSSKMPEIVKLEEDISIRLSRIISSKSVIKTEPPSEDILLPIPQLTVNDGRSVDVDPDYQGHGLQRTIIFSLLELLAENKSPKTKEVGPRNLILIEEPEIYMHPQMERKIADTLYEIASSGKAQVICTTHSPIFIRIAEKNNALVRLVRNHDNVLEATQREEIFSGSDREDKKKKLRMVTNFDPTVNEIFFAKRVVLVEGDTEVAIFREAPELLNYFESEENRHKRRDTTFVNCRGKWTIPLFQEVMNHFGIEYVIIHDKDEEELNQGANGRILEFLGNNESKRKLFDPKIESVLSIEYTGKEKPIKALEQIQKLNNENKLEEKLGEFVKFAYNIS